MRDRDFDRSPRGLAGILVEAGLAVTHTGTEAWQWRVRPEDLWVGLTSVGNFGVTWRAQSEDVQRRLRAAYDGVPGHPVLIGRDHWDGVVASAVGDRGARDYLAAHGVALVECGDLATGVDVDRR